MDGIRTTVQFCYVSYCVSWQVIQFPNQALEEYMYFPAYGELVLLNTSSVITDLDNNDSSNS